MQFEKGPGNNWTMHPNPGGHFTSSAAGLEGRIIKRVELRPLSETDNPYDLIDPIDPKQHDDVGYIVLKCTALGLPADASNEHWFPTERVVREFKPADVTQLAGEASVSAVL